MAAAEHAQANQIFYTSFEDTPGTTSANARTGSRSLAVAGHTRFRRAACPANPAISLLLARHSRSLVAGSAAHSQLPAGHSHRDAPAINGFLDEVRLYPVTGRMRTLTYQPLTGITAETDFNDVSTFYAYDRLGRLAAIRDSEGSIVTAYAYHLGYAGDPAGLNYVRTYTPRLRASRPRPSSPPPCAGRAATVLQSTDYLDGLARVVQQVQKGAPALKRDVVNIVAYDAFGRKAMRPLPFTVDQANGEYKVFDCILLQEFYAPPATRWPIPAKPFAVTRYDQSPLERAVEQGAAGEACSPAPPIHTPWRIPIAPTPPQTLSSFGGRRRRACGRAAAMRPTACS